MPRGGIFGESRRGARDVLKVLKSRDRGHLGPRALIMTHSPMPSTNSCTVAMQQLPRSARGSGTRWLVHKLTQGWKKAFQLAGQLASSLGNLSVQLSDQVSETRAGGRGTVLYRVAYRYPSASAHSGHASHSWGRPSYGSIRPSRRSGTAASPSRHLLCRCRGQHFGSVACVERLHNPSRSSWQRGRHRPPSHPRRVTCLRPSLRCTEYRGSHSLGGARGAGESRGAAVLDPLAGLE